MIDINRERETAPALNRPRQPSSIHQIERSLSSKKMSPKSSLIFVFLTSTLLISFVSSRHVPVAAPAGVGVWVIGADNSSGEEEVT